MLYPPDWLRHPGRQGLGCRRFPCEQDRTWCSQFGHSFTVTPSNAIDRSGNLTSQPAFTKNPPTSTVDQCGNLEATSDALTFTALISGGFLSDDGTPARGLNHRFDRCTSEYPSFVQVLPVSGSNIRFLYVPGLMTQAQWRNAKRIANEIRCVETWGAREGPKANVVFLI